MTKVDKAKGIRNLHYEQRHRIYGYRMKYYDVDGMEFHHITRMPVGMVETKFGNGGDIDLNADQFDCLLNAAIGLNIPLFCLVYYIFDKDGKLLEKTDSFDNFDHIQFYVIPVNSQAKKILPRQSRMTELQWVEILYRLRSLPKVSADEPLCDSWRDVRIPFVTPRP